MISLLYETDYVMLGNTEVRQADWQRIRQTGARRFVLKQSGKSLRGRIGALLILSVLVNVHNIRSLTASEWMVVGYGAFLIIARLIYFAHSWSRLEQRFNREPMDASS